MKGDRRKAMMYRNYVFDLYGTLVDIHTDEEQMLLWEKMAMFYGYQGAFYTPAELHDAFYDTVHSMEEEQKREMLGTAAYAHEAFPEIQIEDVFLGLFQKKNVERDMNFAILTGQFFRALSTEYIKLYDGVPQMLLALKNAGAGVYLLSNAQRAFTEYELKGLDIFRYFDGIFISSDYGTKKPDVHFFEILFQRYSLNPAECLMIGNDRSTDIAGAKAAGMHTFYIHSNLSPDPDNGPGAEMELMQMDIRQVMRMLGLPE